MLDFSFAQVLFLNVGSDVLSSFKSNAAPGAWYRYCKRHMRIGMTLHLAGCLPALFLVIWQFMPATRCKFPLFHRINGHAVIFLVLVANDGALIIARRSFGGGWILKRRLERWPSSPHLGWRWPITKPSGYELTSTMPGCSVPDFTLASSSKSEQL